MIPSLRRDAEIIKSGEDVILPAISHAIVKNLCPFFHQLADEALTAKQQIMIYVPNKPACIAHIRQVVAGAPKFANFFIFHEGVVT